MTTENTNLVLISGKTATGKSASLMGLKEPEKTIYANCENNKRLPFKSKFKEITITDPHTIKDIFDQSRDKFDTFHTIVVDTLTYLMDMFETMYVLKSNNTMKALNSRAA